MNLKKIFKRNPNIIPLGVLLYIAWRNLIHKKLRTFLTIFGIIIGIGSIFFLLSFGLGLQNLVTSQVLGNQSIKSIDIATPNSKILKLDEKSIQKMRDLPHVSRVGTSFSFAGILQRSGGTVDSVVYGMDDDFLQLSSLDVGKGRTFNDTDNRAVIINQAAAEAIGLTNQDQVLDQKVTIRIPFNGTAKNQKEVNDEFTIIGVISTGTGIEVFVPKHIFQTAGIEVYSHVKVEAENNADVAGLRSQIHTLGFLTTSPLDTIDQINQIFQFFNIVLGGIGSIGMIVSVLGMFNTLTISLLERTKEIGLMIAMGSRHRDISRLFILEAVMLSLLGATVGIVLAIVLGQVINIVFNSLAHSRGLTEGFDLFATPWWLILGSIGFMIFVGLAVVFFPARRASRISPIEALRRE